MNTKIALITGGSRGLGRNMALHLASDGRDIIVTYRTKEEEALRLVAELEKLGRKAAALRLDTAKIAGFAEFRASLQRTLREKWGRDTFDFLVNNAGTGLQRSFAETTEAEFDEIINVHYKGVFFLTQALLGVIADGGRIVNISSGLARFSPPGSSAYGSAKAAVESLTRYLARELGPRRISVNVIAPGPIETDFNGGMVRDTPALNKLLSEQTPLGRVGLPDDIGGAVAAVLRDGSAWINGQRIEASGGMLL